MLLSRLSVLRNSTCASGLRSAFLRGPNQYVSEIRSPAPLMRSQQGLSYRKTGFRTRSPREEIQSVTQSTSETAWKADSVGRLFLAGGATLGLGALCYYGLGLSNEIGAIDRAVFWPAYVKERIHSTYMYLAGSVGMTALSAVAVSRTPALMNLMAKGSLLAFGVTMAAMLGAGILVRSISYEESTVQKHLAWALHSGVMGAVIAPLTLLGGPLVIRAAWYTAAIVGGLSTVAVCAPSEKFLNMGGPLAVGLGLVFASSMGSMFFPASSALGGGLYSVSVYGGLLLFSLFLLYDTQKVIRRAETYPVYGAPCFDPINACLGIYMDTLNIFIRIVMILANGGNRRK
ncbi:hypothetical protein DNTS_004321 [Danionella cerebrum]|uniref:Growth hormone-inducible transmembrane protein n=2 Tax=Danionella cerebrum TaxID=2873325 RepID=A0A553N1X5_9TELE|nr:hypothetical protein DNTS_004321 [Danionella translucida]TRY59422.1 hypothetical protein DNTS_004321 [Danionella translucida]